MLRNGAMVECIMSFIAKMNSKATALRIKSANLSVANSQRQPT
eukprot:CAMPEP_0169175542 /NCGR_PEP_ID=MMETSP1015-20121227/65326_1 /TAXON_ID=342587 /ORGANISM="Karlodinium micrum, Strain CCMP2283" /LENGTH=42 /DNA_ID= /DNA_START= /DNA_END= /DNA_ORIENTATION=